MRDKAGERISMGATRANNTTQMARMENATEMRDRVIADLERATEELSQRTKPSLPLSQKSEVKLTPEKLDELLPIKQQRVTYMDK